MAVDLVLRKELSLGKRGTLSLRGLSLEDITSLLHDHLGAITGAVDHYRETQGNVYARQGMDGFVLSLATVFPGLAAEIVSLASDRAVTADAVRNAGAGVQIKALVTVAELTLEDMGDLSDPSPALNILVRQVFGAVSQPRSSSGAFTGASDEQSAAFLRGASAGPSPAS